MKELINNWPSSHRKVFCRNMQGQISNLGNNGHRTRLDLGFAQQRGARGQCQLGFDDGLAAKAVSTFEQLTPSNCCDV